MGSCSSCLDEQLSCPTFYAPSMDAMLCAARFSVDPVTNSNNQQIVETIVAYQASYDQFQLLWASDPSKRETLRREMQGELEQLWLLIADDLVKVARGWMRSSLIDSVTSTQSEAIQSLAMTVFLDIIEALPRLRIDPERNVRGYLASIARRGLYQEHRKMARTMPRSPPTQPQFSAVAEPGFPTFTSPSISELEAVGDPNQDFEEELMRRHHAQATIAAIRDVWENTLTDIDAFIVKHRVECDPPVLFETMAQQLGPGWTASALRKRWQRLIMRTREELRKRGIEP